MAAPTVYGRVTGVIAAGGRARVAGVGLRGTVDEATMTTPTTLYYLRDQRGCIHICDDEGAHCNADMTGAVQVDATDADCPYCLDSDKILLLEGYLNAEPLLAAVWDNDDDARYDGQ